MPPSLAGSSFEAYIPRSPASPLATAFAEDPIFITTAASSVRVNAPSPATPVELAHSLERVAASTAAADVRAARAGEEKAMGRANELERANDELRRSNAELQDKVRVPRRLRLTRARSNCSWPFSPR